MPAWTVCTTRDCPVLTPSGKCENCRRATRRESDRRRPSAARRGYGHAWRALRLAVLRERPTCETEGCRNPSVHVHHRDGLGPNGPRGLDTKNLQALCHSCHSRATAELQPAGWNS